MINLSKQKVNPDESEGWSIDFTFLLKVGKIAEDVYGGEVSLEDIQAVLLATEHVFNDMEAEARLHRESKRYYAIIPCQDFSMIPDKGYQEVKIIESETGPMKIHIKSLKGWQKILFYLIVATLSALITICLIYLISLLA